jgi:Flp pilus assembly protein TadG
MKRAPRNPTRQKGLAAVETALVAGVVLTILFGVFEVARLFFVVNALEEATRRGARVAAVCQVTDGAINEIAIFNGTANISLEYINFNGTVVGDPDTDFMDIDAVRVSIQNYQHDLIIPFFMRTITMPEISTTMPRESLGVTREGFTTC